MKKHTGRAIVVDDEVEIREILEEFLINKGFQVSAFSSALDALKALSPGGELAQGSASGDVDLLISDIKMPVMDGLEFTAELRKLRPEIPIILVTGFGSIETAVEAIKRGAYHYIVKPFEFSELDVNVDRAFELRRLQRDNTAMRTELSKLFGSSLDDFPTLDQIEERYMALILEKTEGHKDKTSQILGINRRTLYRKEREYGFVDSDKSSTTN